MRGGGGGGEVVRQNLCDGRTQHTHTHTPRGGGGLAGRSLGYKGKKKFRGAYSAAARRPQLPPITQPTQTTHHSHQSPPPLPPPPRARFSASLLAPDALLARSRVTVATRPPCPLLSLPASPTPPLHRVAAGSVHPSTRGRQAGGGGGGRRTAGVIDLTKREKHSHSHTHTLAHMHTCTHAHALTLTHMHTQSEQARAGYISGRKLKGVVGGDLCRALSGPAIQIITATVGACV